MKVLIVYASWFGHNRCIAYELARQLKARGMLVAVAPVSAVEASEMVGFDALVLGTYTHGAHASKRIRALCAGIPQRRLEHLVVAIYGDRFGNREGDASDGVDELVACLAERGVTPALPPLRIDMGTSIPLWGGKRLDEAQQRQIGAFADAFVEVCAVAI